MIGFVIGYCATEEPVFNAEARLDSVQVQQSFGFRRQLSESL